MSWRSRNRHRLTRPVILDEDGRAPTGPTHTLDSQVAQARKEMGEARWAELQKEWQA